MFPGGRRIASAAAFRDQEHIAHVVPQDVRHMDVPLAEAASWLTRENVSRLCRNCPLPPGEGGAERRVRVRNREAPNVAQAPYPHSVPSPEGEGE
jgi:5-methylcytosine-specific restriction endonuclease McrA